MDQINLANLRTIISISVILSVKFHNIHAVPNYCYIRDPNGRCQFHLGCEEEVVLIKNNYISKIFIN